MNARAGLGSPYPRPLQAATNCRRRPRAARPSAGSICPPLADAPIRVVMGPQDDEFADDATKLFLDSEWKISATSDRMGYRLEGPVIKHLHGHNIVSDGTVNGSIQVPGNGAADRADAGPRHQRRLSQDRHRDFGRSRAVRADPRRAWLSASRPSAWRRRRRRRENSRNCCAPCPTALRAIENFDLNIEALQDANVAGARRQRGRCRNVANRIARMRWRKINQRSTHARRTSDMTTIDLNCDLGEGFGAWEMGNDAAMIELATSVNIACGFHAGDADIMRKTVELAKARGVSIGAHPGYRDLHGFGRRPFPGMKASEIENLVAYQIGALQAIATAAGHKVTHVKAHGALSNVACEDDMTAKAIASRDQGGRSQSDFRGARQFAAGAGRRSRQPADGARGVRRPRL